MYVTNFVARVACAIAFLFLVSAPALAVTESEGEPTLSAVASFGGAVAIGDNEIFIAEPTDFRNPGTVHVYTRDAEGVWVHSGQLSGPEARVGDRFGNRLAYSEGLLLVGDSNDRSGEVHVFSRGDEEGWQYVETVRGATGDARQGFGSSIAAGSDFVWVGAPGTNGNSGAVYVYKILGESGTLLPISILNGDIAGGRFGSAVATEGNLLAVGSPGVNRGLGSITVYSRTGDNWNMTGSLAKDTTQAVEGFGSSLAIANGRIAVGLPRADTLRGAVEIVEMVDGDWEVTSRISNEGVSTRGMFGINILASGNDLWITAPRNDNARGSLFHYVNSGDTWTEVALPGGDTISPGDQFSSAIAVSDNLALVGAAGDDYGLGSTYVYERNGDDWVQSSFLYQDVVKVDAITGGQVDCSEGYASAFDCSEMDLVSLVPLEDIEADRGVRLNDVWGWTDPETGKEYGLVAHMEGVAFMDVTNPTNPVYLGTLDKTEGTRGNTWRDVKTFKNHAFIVADGAGEHGVQIFDLTQLRDVPNPPMDFKETARYTEVNSVHNIVINEDTGYAYAVGSNSGGETCGGGLHMIDINDPVNPTFAGCFTDKTTGRNNSGATHDSQCVIYNGPDTEHRGKEICISSNGTAISIADVTDKENPTPISTGSYPGFSYVHQGWLTDDHQFFFQNDELDELSGNAEKTRTLVWDFTDLDDPIMIKEYFGPTSATDHNLYVRGRYMYQTNNASGLRVLDISDPANPVEVGHFDTTPYGEDAPGFNGTWSSYPFFESGNVIVTSRREGVFILRKKEVGT